MLSPLPYLTLPYLTLPCLALPYLTLPYLTLPYLTLPYITLHYLTLVNHSRFGDNLLLISVESNISVGVQLCSGKIVYPFGT